ncbi:MAG: hypothetical protein HYX68_12060 [Planctomycetes bacterium]|nr:hypothetical protein [Planctomycetota bacterium]
MPAQLHLYRAPVELEHDETPEPSVNIRLADLLPLLALAKKNNYLWLQDFLEDQVTVTPDLYDVLRSFSTYARTPA